MQQVILGLGSNIEPRLHLGKAVVLLRRQFTDFVLSPIYETCAVGFSGPNFWNLVAGVHTDLTLEELKAALRAIELTVGRPPQAQKWADRCIDIDILIYGNCRGASVVGHLPRADILRHAYVLAPLADVYPDLCHLETGRSFAQHWRDFAGDKTGICGRFAHELLFA
ncbi:MAG TPA: 2-amino-4-hydroxy-6-hydroxymethyldihydropteridine diphosphokinase [Cellvibrionaceae bacterium]|nr:2-amino-4-hydroxy-6-hydroxymethyldihydropteridine diphosphokinase [Cellvibrionaceae bacterium]HNG61497.1 2-amino-4-hydroxy-6-hydroxymethyldihydropteridine diphosphokinase [Cellvibrionaceae bacterium]